MRAAIFNPYLDSLGGGERYSMAVAQILASVGYKVEVEWKSPSIKEKLEERFGIDLSGVNFIRDIQRGDGYDVCFWVSDGSVPTLRARKNLLHFQVPFHDVKGKTLLNRMKLFRINKIICNSYFTKGFIDREYGVNSIVIYPPVDIQKLKPRRKENFILFVGRFSQLTQAKNQDILIRVFKKLYDSGFDSWKLVLAGGVEVGAKDYIGKIEGMVGDYPIEIVKSPSFKELLSLYGRAKIFWSAVGYGAKEDKEPEKVEHFGISVVEAMAAGAIPIVYGAGGYKEIVRDGKNGFTWGNTITFLKRTKELIKDKKLVNQLSQAAITDSARYSYSRFKNEVGKTL
jgi:glycosyltransferase involved in cell wall biosynthesis